MPRNTKDLENSKKEELEKKVESKKSAPKATTKPVTKTEKNVEKKPTSKMAATKKSTQTSKAKSTATSKVEEKSSSTAKKTSSTKVEKKEISTPKKVEPKKTTNNKETKKSETTVKVETKKAATPKAEKVEPKKVEVKKVETKKVETKKSNTEVKKAEVKKSETTPAKKVAVKKSTSTPKSKVANNAAKKSTSSKTTVAKTSTTKKSTSKVTPISDKVAKSETTKKTTEKIKATPVVEEKTSKSKIASLADSLFNKIKQFIAGSQKEEDSKKPNRKAKKLVNQDLTIAGLPEYYDLPYKYNDTVVKILAQTPKRLFIYWDISDKDRKSYIKAFGDDFFDKTYPVLLVHNIDKNYTFEVPVNDFANSWYLDINDSKCQYSIELGRKFKAPVELMEDSLEIIRENNIDLRNDYIYITTSNVLEAPNDHILFEKLPAKITFRNVKTMAEYTVDTKEYVNTSSMNKLYEIEDLYKALYKEEDSDDIYDLSNPSSANPTSTFK